MVGREDLFRIDRNNQAHTTTSTVEFSSPNSTSLRKETQSIPHEPPAQTLRNDCQRIHQLPQYVNVPTLSLLRLSLTQTHPSPTVSGANRGIGLGIVHQILQNDPSAIIFAGARSPSKSTELNDLAKKHPNLHVVELIVDDKESNLKAVEEVKKVVGRLDVVIANAGM